MSSANEYRPICEEPPCEDVDELLSLANPITMFPFTSPSENIVAVGRYSLHVVIFEEQEPDSYVMVLEHTFFGNTEDEARDYAESHMKTDEFFNAAVTEGQWQGIKLEVRFFWNTEEQTKIVQMGHSRILSGASVPYQELAE